MSTFLVVALRADGIVRSARARSAAESRFMRTGFGSWGVILIPCPEERRRSLHSPNNASARHRRHRTGRFRHLRAPAIGGLVGRRCGARGRRPRGRRSRAHARRAGGRRARRARSARQRGRRGVYSEAGGRGDRGRLGCRARSDGQGQLLRHAGLGEASPRVRGRGRDDRGRGRVPALAVIRTALRSEGRAGHADARLRPRPRAGGARMRNRAGAGRRRAGPGSAPSRGDAPRPDRHPGRRRGRRPLPRRSILRDRHQPRPRRGPNAAIHRLQEA